MLFIKIENDGFDLGAQRRLIDENDLPAVMDLLQSWKKAPMASLPFAFAVPRVRILESETISLQADAYRVSTAITHAKWPMTPLGEILDYEQPTQYIVKSVDYKDEYPTLC